MNAAHTPTDTTTSAQAISPAPSPQASAAPGFDPVSGGLSALVDGELTDAELDRLLGVLGHQHRNQTLNQTLATWHSYQVIGDVLRTPVPALATTAAQDFLAGMHARMQSQTQVAPPTWVPSLPTDSSRAFAHVRAPAANDAVFRWKMVAGLASLAAVMAVSWTVLGTAPSGAGGGNDGEAQLAAVVPAPGHALAPMLLSRAVVVNTPQGALIRDAQLEALMAEHRQHGGMSALQMPAGFLRNATYSGSDR
jgi:sigma-E factor negative regulatory protein RseA